MIDPRITSEPGLHVLLIRCDTMRIVAAQLDHELLALMRLPARDPVGETVAEWLPAPIGVELAKWCEDHWRQREPGHPLAITDPTGRLPALWATAITLQSSFDFSVQAPLLICILQAAPQQPQQAVAPPSTTAPSPATDDSTDENPARLYRILVAEDNRENQIVATSFLEKAGYQVEVASDGEAAVSAVVRGGIDLVLMDCMMPALDGFSACRQIRTVTRNQPRLPIIALTAHSGERDQAACLAAGMDDFLAKPFSPTDLIDKVRQWLAFRRSVPFMPATPTGHAADLATVDACTAPLPPPSEPGPSITLNAAVAFGALGDEIDLERLRLSTMNNDKHRQTLIQGFCQNMPIRLGKLKSALAASDQRLTEFYCHSIKGAASMLGAERLRRLAEQAEHHATTGDLATVAQLVGPIESAFNAIGPTLTAMLTAARATPG